jgi:hypothetical protein
MAPQPLLTTVIVLEAIKENIQLQTHCPLGGIQTLHANMLIELDDEDDDPLDSCEASSRGGAFKELTRRVSE